MVDTDLALLDRWCAGDKAAGNALFKTHFNALYRFFEHKTDGEIDDLVQETFLECMKSRDRFQRQSTFRTYLFAIARHVLFHHWRRRATTRTTLDFDEVSIASLSTSATSRLARNHDRARLLSVLRTLPLDQQLLVEMYYWEGMDRSQLAEVFDVETATIGSRLFRAREALEEGLTTSGPVAASPEAFESWARSLATDA